MSNVVTVYAQNNIAVFAQGLQGPQGAAGVGLPVGGTTGQVLSKIDATNYHVQWADVSSTGGGSVSSVNTQTGAVVLTQDNIAAGTTNGVYTLVEKSKLAGIATAATANQSDAYLLSRANHAGTQAAATITGLATVATTGAYADLSGKPTLGTLASQNGTFSGTSSGTNTGDQTSVTGNAGTATTLQTARTINGVSFDGSANITVAAAAGTLTGTALASGVVSSSLTSVGTLANLTVTNPIAGSVTGNAATVTTINGRIAAGTNMTLTGSGTSASPYTIASLGGFTPVVNYYTSSTTMADPGAGCKIIRVVALGAGGGGGSGRNTTTSAARGGGAGGSAGAYVDIEFAYSDVPSWPVTITIGAGGAGGASQTGAGNGNPGSAGGDSSFGSLVVVKGGLGGAGGTSTTSVGGEARFGSLMVAAPGNASVPIAGGQGNAGASAVFNGAHGFAGSGGGANGATSANVTAAGAAGGSNQKGAAGGAGGAAGSAGTNGADADTTAPYVFIGGCGGGGAGGSTAAALAGGNGGKYGAGGGGGSNGTSGTHNSGAGGNGADGFMKVIAR